MCAGTFTDCTTKSFRSVHFHSLPAAKINIRACVRCWRLHEKSFIASLLFGSTVGSAHSATESSVLMHVPVSLGSVPTMSDSLRLVAVGTSLQLAGRVFSGADHRQRWETQQRVHGRCCSSLLRTCVRSVFRPVRGKKATIWLYYMCSVRL